MVPGGDSASHGAMTYPLKFFGAGRLGALASSPPSRPRQPTLPPVAAASAVAGAGYDVSNAPLDAPRTRERIRCEWAIAERGTQPFSVVVFSVNRQPAGLLAALRARLRAGDDIGWLDGERLALLMPLTSVVEARRIADGLVSEVSAGGQPIRFTLHAFEPATGGGASGPVRSTARAEPTSEATLPLAILVEDPLPWWKRAVDVVGALLGLIVFAPLLLLAACMVKLSSPGPILFRQQRAGWLGVPFVIYKFRTMVEGAEALKERLQAFNERRGPVFKMQRDPRVTTVGRWLRVTSIDELPQLWNVLIGDMSLVGPRPPSLDELPAYQAWQHHRLDVKPGITGLWQVEARGGVEFEDWVRMDLRYIRRRSLLFDLLLIVRTVPAVVTTRGAS
jgi:lipopolysaccharide/colanic/teichoic acid biosynthesis glycosyltransferase